MTSQASWRSYLASWVPQPIAKAASAAFSYIPGLPGQPQSTPPPIQPARVVQIPKGPIGAPVGTVNLRNHCWFLSLLNFLRVNAPFRQKIAKDPRYALLNQHFQEAERRMAAEENLRPFPFPEELRNLIGQGAKNDFLEIEDQGRQEDAAEGLGAIVNPVSQDVVTIKTQYRVELEVDPAIRSQIIKRIAATALIALAFLAVGATLFLVVSQLHVVAIAFLIVGVAALCFAGHQIYKYRSEPPIPAQVHSDEQSQSFGNLEVPIERDVYDLNNLLKIYFNNIWDQNHAENNLHKDPKTEKLSRVLREKTQFVDAPPSLMIQLKRFEYDIKTRLPEKNTSSIAIPNQYQITPIEGAPANYELNAFIRHHGASANQGHYTCYVKERGKWYWINDERVSEVPEAALEEAKSNAYMFHFAKI